MRAEPIGRHFARQPPMSFPHAVLSQERHETKPMLDAPPLPLAGRGIAYGFEASIALEDKTDSEDDSRIMEGVGWASTRRISCGCRTRAQTMRDTNCWRCCSSRWLQCCAEPSRARIWRDSGGGREGVLGFS